MLVLALDTSSPAVTVALLDRTVPAIPIPDGIASGERFPFVASSQPHTSIERCVVAANRHGELLAPLLREVMAEAAAAPQDLSAVAVGLGPGPFTGLRVGIMTARALSDALAIPAYGECSLDVIARAHTCGRCVGLDNDVEEPFAVVTDARRNQVYWAAYQVGGGRTAPPDLGRPNDVAEALRGRVTHVVGAGAALYGDAFGDYEVVGTSPYPSAAELADMAYAKLVARRSGDALTPLYLRRPDAQPPGRPKAVTPA